MSPAVATPVRERSSKSTASVIALVLGACVIRGVLHVVAPKPPPREIEWIFGVLAVLVLVSGVVLVRHMKGLLPAAVSVGAASLLVGSSTGALLRAGGMHAAGTIAPSVSYFYQPFQVKGAAGREDPGPVRLEIQFGRPSPLDPLLAKVADGALELHLKVPGKCSAKPCRMSIAYSDGRSLAADIEKGNFEIRIPADHPLVRDRARRLTLLFQFSGEIVLFERDMGAASATRTDRLVHEGREVPLSHDHLLFVRFLFLDPAGRPHAAIY